MSDIIVRRSGRAGRITLARPEALNALTDHMLKEIAAALALWRDDNAIALVVIDAEGDKAFCAGGDIADLYATGRKGDFAFGQKFWRDEYRLNAEIAAYPKPIVSFLQGFTMGGGVGVGCHGSHRIVCESSQIAMPEVGIGLVPDVGGSLILANAPGRLGEYLGITAARMDAADAIFAGFADVYVPQAAWPALITALEESGDVAAIAASAEAPEGGKLAAKQALIDAAFDGAALNDIHNALIALTDENASEEVRAFATTTQKQLARNAPLSMACAVEMIHRLRGKTDLRVALELEYRFTARAMEHGDFLEGIRAAIIDKDRQPKWRHAGAPSLAEVARMLQPLGKDKLTFLEGDLP